MALFRINPDNPIDGPHQHQPVSTAGATANETTMAMILVHGRGASADGMLLFADEFNRDDVHYRALQASGHTWYPHSFLAPKEQNQPGINSGLQAIYDQVQFLNKTGISTDHIMLLGFSQGACLASEFAARHPRRYGGIFALSGGLIGPEIKAANYKGSFENTAVFLGCSDRDPHIPKERVDETEQVFKQLEADVTKNIYQGMGHTVNEDEIKHIRQIMDNIS